MNQVVKIDLTKVNGAAVVNLKGKTSTKRCVVIPIEDAGLYEGVKGVYLDLIAFEMREPKNGSTHLLKRSVPKEKRDAMTPEERASQPILGTLSPMGGAPAPLQQAPAVEAGIQQDGVDITDLPF